MALKDKFLSFVEMHRSANATKEAYGPDDPRTVDAYQNLNLRKREIAEAIDELEYFKEYFMKSLEK